MAINIQSEEDVKLKIVIPYLQELGFIKEELEFETNFQIKFGKSVIPIGAEKPIYIANARLDILVKYQGKNICVFEVKKDTIKLSEDDIKQAVSYSSLVRPMPPFCILTNGKEFILVDTISSEIFQKNEINRYAVNGYRATLPDESYYERFKHFLGYSKDNLMKFCEEQISQYIKPLRGSKEEPNKKYIKEIYEASEKLTKELNKFVCQNEYSSFVLVAKSGMGKTCWSCHTVETFLENGIPTLFYRANDIKKGIFEAITDDLNWTLSPQFTVAQGIKRFFDIFENESVYIIIDGLDEIEVNLARELTEEFFRRIKSHNVKLITTCKPEIWTSLLAKDEIPSRISEETFNGSFILDELERSEFYKIVDKYREFYNFKGLFQDEVLNDCKRNLYLLRVMFEVASSEQTENLTYTFAGFFQHYYMRIVNRFELEKRESIKIILNVIGKLLYERNCDYVDIRDVRETLKLGALEVLPTGLFDLNILDKREGEHTEDIGFYFQRFRDYIISFRVFQWQTLTPQNFKITVGIGLGINGVKLNVMELYYLLASEEHKRVLDRPLYDRAYEYVTFYENVLDTCFLSIKERFTPHTKGQIGFVGYFNISMPEMLMYGFRNISQSEPKVLLIPSSGVEAPKDNNLAYIFGVEAGMRMQYPSIFAKKTSIAEYILNNDIPRELQEVLMEGKLDESNSITLTHEKLFAAGYSFYPEFVGVDSHFSGVMIKQFPLKKLKEGVLAKRAFRMLESELVKKKLSSGEIKVNQEGDYISYSYRISEEEKEILWQKAIQISQEGENYPSKVRYSGDDDFEEEILANIRQFDSAGITEVRDPISVRRDKLQKFNELYWGYHPDIEYAELYLAELLKIALEEHRTLIDSNFSLFKEAFPQYRDVPLTFFISIIPPSERLRRLTYTFDVCKPINKVDYQYSIVVTPFECKKNNDKLKIYDGKEYEIIYWRRGDFQNYLTPTMNFCSFKSNDYLLCIRSLVYRLITENFNLILTKIAERYGVRLKGEFNFSHLIF